MIDVISCIKCFDHYCNSPHLTEACASVGIERGMSTSQMVRAYLADFHKRGHKPTQTEAGDQP